jgi:hypothetical protein
LTQAYAAAGGMEALGRPVAQATCGLPDQGCVQDFELGALYLRGSDGATGVAPVAGKAGWLVAAARADVGYAAQPGEYTVDTSKFNQWLDWSGPWCHIYLEYAAEHVGLEDLIGRYGPLFRFVDHMRADFTQIERPEVGAFALMSTSDTFSHIGLISEVSADGASYLVLDGNQAEGGGPKAVLERWVGTGERLPTEFWKPNY